VAKYSSSFFVRKFKAFFLLILSSLGFSVGLVLARLNGDESLLPKILDFQSVVVLVSFVLQLGSRAALRVHHYNNRHRLVNVSEDFLYLLLVPLSVLGLFFETYFDRGFYIVASCALTLVTLRLALSVARQDLKAQFKYTVVNFLLCISGSLFFIVEVGGIRPDILIELLSLLIILTLYEKIDISIVIKYRKAIFSIFYKAQSYQFGSGAISFMVFVLTQSMILNYSDSIVMVAYTDIQIASGFLTLFIGQALLLFESKLYAEDEARLKVFGGILLLQIFLAILFSSIVCLVYEVSFSLMFVISFILSSRVVLGYIVQYAAGKRLWLNLFFCLLLMFYLTYYLFFLGNDIEFQIVPVFLFVTFGCCLFWVRRQNAK